MSGGEDLLVSYYSAILAKACSVGDDFAQLYDIIVERCSKDQADHALEKARQLSLLNPKTLAIKIRWLESKIPKSLRISCDMNLPSSPQSDNIVKDESSAISSKPKGYVVVNVGNSVDDGIGFSLSNVSLDTNIDARKKLNPPIVEKFENENSIELGSMRKKTSKTRENISTDDSKSSKNKTNCDGSSVKSNRNQRRKKLKADQKNKDIVSTASAEVPPARNNKPSKKQNKESKKEETKQMLTSPSTSSPTVKSLELGDQLEEKKTTPNADILTDEVVQQILQKCDPLSDKKQKPMPKEKSQKKKKKKTKKTTSDERKQQENCFKENVQHQGELKDLSDPCNGYDIIADNCNDTMIWPHTDDFMMSSSYSSKVKTNLDSKGNSLASSSEECSSYTTGQSTPGINELAPDSGVQDIIGSMKPLVQEDFPPLSDFITVLHSKKIDPESGKNAATNDFTTPIGATDLTSVKRDLNEDPILSVEVDTLLHNEWGLNFMPDNKELQLLPPFNLPCSSKIGNVPLTDCKDILFQHVDENQNNVTFNQEELCFGFDATQQDCVNQSEKSPHQIPTVQPSNKPLSEMCVKDSCEQRNIYDVGDFDIQEAAAYFRSEWEMSLKNGTKFESLEGI